MPPSEPPRVPHEDLASWQPRLTVRLRLTLSYTALLLFAGVVVLAGVYLVLRYGPDNPSPFPRWDGALADERETALLQVSIAILVSLAAIGIVGGWVLAGRMLRPLQAITATARHAANTGSFDHRVQLHGRPDEFTELADTFDTMLDRLQASFEEQRRFAANASHELRTPHAVMKTMLEVAIRDPGHQDVEQLARRLYETNQRGIDIVEALLTLASLSDRQVDTAPIDFDQLVREALQPIELEAQAADVSVEACLQPATVEGNSVLLHQLVMNLGQNAVRHNHPGGHMSLALRFDATADVAVLEVSNSGPHLRREDVHTFTEPFVRGEGRVAAHEGRRRGAGLGLALVSRIVELHAGALSLEPNANGGLTATVTLPASGPPENHPRVHPHR